MSPGIDWSVSRARPLMALGRCRSIANILVFAMLFSAVSPAIAAVVLKERPHALAQMLGIKATTHDAHAAHDMHEHNGGAPPPLQDHSDHGIYCSLCLNANSIVAITVASAPVLVSALAFESPVIAADTSFISAFQPFFRSRAPPAL